MEKYIEQFIPSQCRITKDATLEGTINLEGDAMIFTASGTFLGVANANIGFIKEEYIDTAIKLLCNYKRSLNSKKKASGNIIKFDFKNSIRQGGEQ